MLAEAVCGAAQIPRIEDLGDENATSETKGRHVNGDPNSSVGYSFIWDMYVYSDVKRMVVAAGSVGSPVHRLFFGKQIENL